MLASDCFELRLSTTSVIPGYPPLTWSSLARKCGAYPYMSQHQLSTLCPANWLHRPEGTKAHSLQLLLPLLQCSSWPSLVLATLRKEKVSLTSFFHYRCSRPTSFDPSHIWLSQTNGRGLQCQLAEVPHREDSHLCSERGKCLRLKWPSLVIVRSRISWCLWGPPASCGQCFNLHLTLKPTEPEKNALLLNNRLYLKHNKQIF